MEELNEIILYKKLPIFGAKNSGKSCFTKIFEKNSFNNEEHTTDSNKNNII